MHSWAGGGAAASTRISLSSQGCRLKACSGIGKKKVIVVADLLYDQAIFKLITHNLKTVY